MLTISRLSLNDFRKLLGFAENGRAHEGSEFIYEQLMRTREAEKMDITTAYEWVKQNFHFTNEDGICRAFGTETLAEAEDKADIFELTDGSFLYRRPPNLKLEMQFEVNLKRDLNLEWVATAARFEKLEGRDLDQNRAISNLKKMIVATIDVGLENSVKL